MESNTEQALPQTKRAPGLALLDLPPEIRLMTWDAIMGSASSEIAESNTKQALSQITRAPGLTFADLPPEIRLMIWDAVMDADGRLISTSARRPKPSVTLWVNYESRRRAMERGNRAAPAPRRAVPRGEHACLYWGNPRAGIVSIDESRWGFEDAGSRQPPTLYRSLASLARRCIVKEFLCRDSLGGAHYWDAALGHGRSKQTRLGELFARMDTIFVRPFCLDHGHDFSKEVILSLNPEHIRPVQRQLFGENEDFLVINLLNTAQVQKSVGLLSSCDNEAIGHIVRQLRHLLEWLDDFQYRGLGLTWWQMVIGTAQRIWLDYNYDQPAVRKDVTTTYRPRSYEECPEPCHWDPKDLWVKKTLDRFPDMQPVMVLAIAPNCAAGRHKKE
ncbi:hypothetical protein LQW54_001259 [Pestalotiopsis sp. IQ-011]